MSYNSHEMFAQLWKNSGVQQSQIQFTAQRNKLEPKYNFPEPVYNTASTKNNQYGSAMYLSSQINTGFENFVRNVGQCSK